MPKYFCDYCDVYLTHDSLNVRRSHNAGWKHKANVRAYYAQFLETTSIHPIFGFKGPNFQQQLQTFQVPNQQNQQIPLQSQQMVQNPLLNPNFQFQFQQNQQQNQFVQNMNK